MMRVNSMEIWTKPLPLQEFPAKAWLSGVGTISKPPGGLRKSEEARAFRRKLMREAHCLEGGTLTFFPPHMLGAIVHPYVQDMPGPQGAGLTRLLQKAPYNH